MTRSSSVLLMVAVLALGVGASPRAAQAQFPFTGNFTLWDDFSSLLLDRDRWVPREAAGGALNPNTDTFRGIVSTKTGPQAQLLLHSWGNQNSNVGRRGDFEQRLDFTTPEDITTIIAQITMLKVSVVDCKANLGNTTRAAAGIEGRFFNTSTTGAPGDQKGDVFATIALVQDSVAKAQLQALLLVCDDASCNSSSLVIPIVVFATGWKLNQARYYGIQWDKSNHNFIVAVLDQNFNSLETKELNYAGVVSDTEGPFVQQKSIMVSHNLANCQSPAKRTEANTTAQFTNVWVPQ